MRRRILIMGLPGSGKTTLARELAPLISAVVFNGGDVRANIGADLGFSIQDRIEQARRMAWLCDQVVKAGGTAIADFVCPIEEAREAFGPAFTVWVDRIAAGRYADTNALFTHPKHFDVRVSPQGEVSSWVREILQRLPAPSATLGFPGERRLLTVSRQLA
jgi:adenylylsulfate kinase